MAELRKQKRKKGVASNEDVEKIKAVIYILLGLVALYFLAPFIYMLFSAFKTEGEAIAYPPKLFPSEWHFENFANAWKSQPFGTYLLNSVLVTALTTIGQVLFLFFGCLWICKI